MGKRRRRGGRRSEQDKLTVTLMLVDPVLLVAKLFVEHLDVVFVAEDSLREEDRGPLGCGAKSDSSAARQGGRVENMLTVGDEKLLRVLDLERVCGISTRLVSLLCGERGSTHSSRRRGCGSRSPSCSLGRTP